MTFLSCMSVGLNKSQCVGDDSAVMIGSNAFFYLKDNLCGFVGTFCFKIISFIGFCGFVYHDLSIISILGLEVHIRV
jgi:hypothetical protein